jgi:hypothetical protein
MADQILDEAGLPGEEIAPELPLEEALPPGAGEGLPVEEGLMPEGGDEFDIEALLSDIDSGMGEAPQAPPPGGSQTDSMVAALRAAREAMAADEESQMQDGVTQRFQNIEQEVNRLRDERNAISQQQVRDGINMTINVTVGDELSRMEIDPTTGPGKAFARLLANSAMVAVAKEQTRQGKQEIDLRSVKRTVTNYSKLLERVSKEMATRQNSKQRRAAAGAAKAPVTLSKPVGDMTNDEFDAAVLAAFSNR